MMKKKVAKVHSEPPKKKRERERKKRKKKPPPPPPPPKKAPIFCSFFFFHLSRVTQKKVRPTEANFNNGFDNEILFDQIMTLF